MGEPVEKSPAYTPRHTAIASIATIFVAAISGFAATRVAHINQKTEMEKAALGYANVADRVNKMDAHVEALEKNQLQMAGALTETNRLLQNVFESQSGLKHKDIPPPRIKTYGELPGKDRPYLRTLIGRRVMIPPPKKAASDAVEGLKTLEAKTVPLPKEALPKLEPLPAKLENVTTVPATK